MNLIFGFSKLDKIGGIPEENYHILNDLNRSFGGHFIDTFMQELFDFDSGSDIRNVIPQRLPTIENSYKSEKY